MNPQNKDSDDKMSKDKINEASVVSKRKRKRPAWMVEDELVKDIDDEQFVAKSKVSKTKVFEKKVSVNEKSEKIDPLEDTLKEIFEPNEKTVKLLNSKAQKMSKTTKVSKDNMSETKVSVTKMYGSKVFDSEGVQTKVSKTKFS